MDLGVGLGGDIRVVAFDLDDTLTVSKAEIEPRMADLLARLLERVDVCIISGGRFEQFELQVLKHLPIDTAQRTRLHLMPTCGTRYYRWRDTGWRQVYAEDFSPAEKRRVAGALRAAAQELGLWETTAWGEIIEDRGSQVTYSALGQAAPPEAKYAWDPDGSKKRRLRDRVAAELPDLEVRSGGSTSIDVTRKGIDKAYGMRKLIAYLDLSPERILFIGDRLEEGGNDYPVKATGIGCLAVDGWPETADTIERLLTADPREPG
jgi:phosphomannomutase